MTERETLFWVLGMLQMDKDPLDSADKSRIIKTIQENLRLHHPMTTADTAVTSIPFANIHTNVTC